MASVCDSAASTPQTVSRRHRRKTGVLRLSGRRRRESYRRTEEKEYAIYSGTQKPATRSNMQVPLPLPAQAFRERAGEDIQRALQARKPRHTE